MRKSDMKAILGIVMIIGGIALGIYVGVWLMFIGGIIQLVNGIKATPVEAMAIAYGIARIALAGVTGFVCAIALIIPGKIMLD